MSRPEIDFGHIAEPVARMLFGEPNSSLSNSKELRFGNNGSLKVVISGEKAGTFYDFEDEEGGGLLRLIARETNGDERSAVEWLQAQGFVEPAQDPISVGPPANDNGPQIEAIYSYEDEHGRTVFEAVRLKPKGFRQRKSANEWTVKGVRIIPYRLPELTEAIALERPVFIAEGEKDCDRLATLGLTATCNAGGAGKWTDKHAQFLKDADVVILPDNDEPGRNHANKVARSLLGIANRIRVLELPGLPEKGDVSDWFDNGGDVERFNRHVEETSNWRPQSIRGLVWLGEEDQLPPRDWLVKSLLGEGELSVLYAPSGGGKSFLALDLAARIASGLPWFGHKVSQSAVLYVCGEGVTGFRQRMTGWRKRNDIDDAAFAMLPGSIDLMQASKPGQADTAIDIINDCRAEIADRSGLDLKLIVLDTASRMMPGGVDSDPKDMKAFLENVEELRNKTKAHILIVTHTGKDTGRGMRGSTMLRDYADLVIELKKPEDGDETYTAVVDKMKDGDDGRKYRFRLVQTVIGEDADGSEITTCAIEPLETGATSKSVTEPYLGKHERAALDLLKTLIGSTNAADGSDRESVAIEKWRKDCLEAFGIKNSGSRTTWKRTWEGLRSKGLITVENGRVRPA